MVRVSIIWERCFDSVLWSCKWSPGSKSLFVSPELGNFYCVNFYKNFNTNSLVYSDFEEVVTCHGRSVRSFAHSPRHDLLAAASFDGSISVWSLAAHNYLDNTSLLEGADSEVKSVSFDSTGRFLVSTTRKKQVWVWEFDELENEFYCAAVLKGHSGDVKRALMLDDLTICSCGYDGLVIFWAADHSEEEVAWRLAHRVELGGTVWGVERFGQGEEECLIAFGDEKKLWVINKRKELSRIELGSLGKERNWDVVYDCAVWKEWIVFVGEYGVAGMVKVEYSAGKWKAVELKEIELGTVSDLNSVWPLEDSDILACVGDEGRVVVFEVGEGEADE